MPIAPYMNVFEPENRNFEALMPIPPRQESAKQATDILGDAVKAWLQWRLSPPPLPRTSSRADVEEWAGNPPTQGIDPGGLGKLAGAVTAAQVRRAIKQYYEEIPLFPGSVTERVYSKLRIPEIVQWANKEWRNVGDALRPSVSRLGAGAEATAMEVQPGNVVLKLYPTHGPPPLLGTGRDWLPSLPSGLMLPELKRGEFVGPELGGRFGYLVQPRAEVGTRMPQQELDAFRKLVENKLRGTGWEVWDFHPANVGTWQNRPWLIDPGSLVNWKNPR